MRFRRTGLVLSALAACSLASTATAAEPKILLYGTKLSVKKIIRPDHSTALPVNGRLHVVEPNGGHLWAGDADKEYRIGKVKASTILSLATEKRIARYLKYRIDNPCNFTWGTIDCRSNLIIIDEIGNRFNEPAPNIHAYPWNQPTSKLPTFRPRLRDGQPGVELSQAMKILANIPHGDGDNYARHVLLFMAPGPVSSLGKGLGPYHNLGRNGRPYFPTYEGVRRAFQLSGGVWLEMYHYNGRTRYPFNTLEWRRYPYNVMKWMTRPGTKVYPAKSLIRKTHFMMSNKMPRRVGTRIPGACFNRRTPQRCQFALASSRANRPILNNGPGAYRMEGNEAEWRGYVRRLFFQ